MFYLTLNNFRKVLAALELDIPALYENVFYSKYPNQLGLDLNYFSKKEAKSLVIAEMLVKDFTGTMQRIEFNLAKENQKSWVNEVVSPCYHTSAVCDMLTEDFLNFKIPAELQNTPKEEAYRAYFKAHILPFRSTFSEAEELAAAAELKARFGLKQDEQEIVKENIKQTRYHNSDIAAFNATLDFEKEAEEIKKTWEEFVLFVRPLNPSRVKKAGLVYNKAMRAEIFSKSEIKLFEEVQTKKAMLAYRIINFYFQHFQAQGFEFSEQFLQMCGLRICKMCKNNPQPHLTSDSDNDILPF